MGAIATQGVAVIYLLRRCDIRLTACDILLSQSEIFAFANVYRFIIGSRKKHRFPRADDICPYESNFNLYCRGRVSRPVKKLQIRFGRPEPYDQQNQIYREIKIFEKFQKIYVTNRVSADY